MLYQDLYLIMCFIVEIISSYSVHTALFNTSPQHVTVSPSQFALLFVRLCLPTQAFDQLISTPSILKYLFIRTLEFYRMYSTGTIQQDYIPVANRIETLMILLPSSAEYLTHPVLPFSSSLQLYRCTEKIFVAHRNSPVVPFVGCQSVLLHVVTSPVE